MRNQSRLLRSQPFTVAQGASILMLLFLLILAVKSWASVPTLDITLQKPVTDNVAVVAPNIGYGTGSGPLPGPQIPLYAPYDTGTTQWWDNLVAELVQARLTVLNLNNRGIHINSPDTVPTGGGNMDPRRLTQLLNAMDRAGVSDMFRFTNGVDTAAPRAWQNRRNQNNLPYDMSVTSDWDDIWWQKFIKPWHDTIPSKYWYRIYGRPAIYLWSINGFVNRDPYASQMLIFLRQKFLAEYGEDPVFILTGWLQEDPAVANLDFVVAQNPWWSFTTGWNMQTFKGYTTGTIVAGYGSGNPTIPRNGGNTFQAGLSASFVNSPANFMFLEGWTNNIESMGVYRSKDADWAYPNQYINMLPLYTDARTVTQRLEAEGADSYSDTTTGNTGGKYRSDDLDVKERTGGWQVGWTAPGEWIEFKNVPLSAGNYKFVVRYGSPAAHSLRLIVDGVAQPNVTVPSTGSSDTMDTIYLTSAAKPLAHGPHTFRLQWVDGGVDVDWLFLKKVDPIISLKSPVTGKYLTALKGGSSTLETNGTLAAAWQHFTVDDATGTLTSNNPVYLQAHNGLYITAEGGGGGTVNSSRRTPSSWETWRIIKVSGSGPLQNGDQVRLESSNGSYLSTQSNGYIYANNVSPGPSETFILGIANVDAAPSPPSALTATAASGSQINLSWTDNATNESAYYVERSIDRVNYSVIATLNPNTTSYSDSGLTGYTPVYYRVRASNPTANSDYSLLASATTQPGISATPGNVTAYSQPSLTGASVKLLWSVSNGATSYQVKRAASSAGPFSVVGTSNSTSYVDTAVSVGTTYFYVVNAVNSFGTSANSGISSATPTAFSQASIGGTTGSGSYSNGVFSLTGMTSGDIWGPSDKFQFAYQTLTGDGSITARVTSIGGTYDFTKSAVMIRETLNPDSVNVLMSLLYNNQTNFQFRPSTGANSEFKRRITVSKPQWIRLERKGSVFYASYSSDGIAWFDGGSITATLPNAVYVGLGQSQGYTGTFDNVMVKD